MSYDYAHDPEGRYGSYNDCGEGMFWLIVIWLFSPVIGAVANFLANGGLRTIILLIVAVAFFLTSLEIMDKLWQAFIRNREKKHGMKYNGTCASIYGVLRFYKTQNGANAKKPTAKKK